MTILRNFCKFKNRFHKKLQRKKSTTEAKTNNMDVQVEINLRELQIEPMVKSRINLLELIAEDDN